MSQAVDIQGVEACEDGSHHITSVDGYGRDIPAGYAITVKM